jgi:Adenosylmethionine-8-amino-7-oxononanoate aminotransferase
MGTGGLVPPPEGYWPEIKKILNKYDVHLIADEVVTGFGRTGEMFGSAKYAPEPDLITIAKGLTSGYVPLSGAIISKKVSEVLKQGSDQLGMFSHGYTYTGHALGAAAGLANLQVIEDKNLVGNVKDVGAYFQAQLRDKLAAHEIVGEVRGVGLMAAIELASDKAKRTPFDADLKVNKKLADKVFEHNVIIRPMPNSCAVGIAPPFVITRDDVDLIVGSIAESLESVSAEL